ncbi:hypothetical protein BJX96DRAFT_86607 [Aspergillus floccosus]
MDWTLSAAPIMIGRLLVEPAIVVISVASCNMIGDHPGIYYWYNVLGRCTNLLEDKAVAAIATLSSRVNIYLSVSEVVDVVVQLVTIALGFYPNGYPARAIGSSSVISRSSVGRCILTIYTGPGHNFARKDHGNANFHP